MQLRDEDVEMDDGSSKALSCRECLSLFCSDRCARENIAAHRKTRHGVKTPSADEAEELVSCTQDVVATALKAENPGLSMTRVEE